MSNPIDGKSNPQQPLSAENASGNLGGHKITVGAKFSSLIQTIIGFVCDLFTKHFFTQSQPFSDISKHAFKISTVGKPVEVDKDAIDAELSKSKFKEYNVKNALDGIDDVLFDLFDKEVYLTFEALQGDETFAIQSLQHKTEASKISNLKLHLKLLQNLHQPLISLAPGEKITKETLAKLPPILEQFVKYCVDKSLGKFDAPGTLAPLSAVAEVFGPLCFPKDHKDAAKDLLYIFENHKTLFP